jgi:hypothetical protein
VRFGAGWISTAAVRANRRVKTVGGIPSIQPYRRQIEDYPEITERVTLNEIKGPKKQAEMLHFPSLLQDKRPRTCPARAGSMTLFFSNLVPVSKASLLSRPGRPSNG